MRDYNLYLQDIFKAIQKIERYTLNLSYDDFIKDELKQDGVIRNLEIIGEAVKNLPDEIKNNHTAIEWRKIAGIRDILIHAYFYVDMKIIWDIITLKIPEFKKKVLEIWNNDNFSEKG